MHRLAGYTYIELTFVVLVVGLLATVALPDFRTSDAQKLEMAAEEIAGALRFARSRAKGAGYHTGVSISAATQQVSVFRADMAADPVDIDTLELHPLTQRDFTFEMDSGVRSGVQIVNTDGPFYYEGTGYRTKVLFNPAGAPVWKVAATDTTYQLTSAKIELALAEHRADVELAPYSGRVSLE